MRNSDYIREMILKRRKDRADMVACLEKEKAVFDTSPEIKQDEPAQENSSGSSKPAE